MNSRPCGLAAVALAIALTTRAIPVASSDRPIDSLIQAERDFSAASIAHGMRSAFLANLGEDAVIFRPGPINGMQSWKSRTEVPGRLEWAPEFVELSGAEDLGFSIGPWEYRVSAEAKEAEHGHFLTVWRRDPHGAWKVALDCGISHPPGGRGPRDVEVIEGPFHAPPDTNAWRQGNLQMGVAGSAGGVSAGGGTGGFGISFGGGGIGFGVGSHTPVYRSPLDYEQERTSHERNNLLTADRALDWNARKSGWEHAYVAVAANDLRFLRDGAEPALGLDAVAEASASRSRDLTWSYRGNGLSKSWDLGYVYGTVIARTKGKSRPDTSAFVHLFRTDEGGKWRMTADWEQPFSKR
ncbi:MAG TPA: hypothetical protein VMJ70_15960 [Candidatus Sulfotelmatobacter sp.]|nr:hypothetical protein [Candidatus Sulfotelmatobacter sp.]